MIFHSLCPPMLTAVNAPAKTKTPRLVQVKCVSRERTHRCLEGATVLFEKVHVQPALLVARSVRERGWHHVEYPSQSWRALLVALVPFSGGAKGVDERRPWCRDIRGREKRGARAGASRQTDKNESTSLRFHPRGKKKTRNLFDYVMNP